MALAVAILAILAFALLFARTGIARVTSGALGIARTAQQTMFDPALGDEQKEPLIQKAAGDMFSHALQIAVRLFICLAAPLALVYLAELAGVASIEDSMAWLLSWQLLLAACLLFGGLWWLRR